MRIWRALFTLFCLSGCTGGAVQFAPTPPPLESLAATYRHPSGAFSLVLPPNWSVYSQNLTQLATASFAPPDSEEPLLLVAVANLGAPIEANALGDLLFQYQTQIRPDVGRYTEQDRQAMSDGSWRLTGVRLRAADAPQLLNTFIQRQGSLLAIIEVVLPPDNATLRAQLQTIVNTVVIGPQADLAPSDIGIFAKMAYSSLEVANVHAWTTPEGVFFITGEVVNRGLDTVADVPVRATIWSADDIGLAEALDTVMAYSVRPGEFAPFSLRFGQGQPPSSAYYRIEVGYDGWQAPSLPVVASEALSWTDAISYNQSNQLQISGIITNISADTLTNVRAIVTVFDADERVIAAGYTPSQPETLEPGEAANYLIVIPELGGAPSNYIVSAQAYVRP